MLRRFNNVRFYQTKTRAVYGYNPKKEPSLRTPNAIPKSLFDARNERSNLFRFISGYRKHGHKFAQINPIYENSSDENNLVLRPEYYGLDRESYTANPLLSADVSDLKDITEYLRKIYCGKIGVEFDSIENEAESEWLYKRHEETMENSLSVDKKRRIAKELLRSQNFDYFLATKFPNVKRYGGEGAETMMVFFVEMLSSAGEYNIEEIVLGMPHRGRLNLLTGLLQFPPVAMFRKMKGLPEFPSHQKGAGDVLSHFANSVDISDEKGHTCHVTMLPNPSHLEAVNPVACGKTRGKHMVKKIGDYDETGESTMGDNTICVLVHGDAALSGQGINQETLQLANLPHFNIGGTVHLIVNNQVGFTTPSDRGRSSRYCSCLAKQIGAPIIHVNGDYPEYVARATKLAIEYQRQFRKDVFVDIVCFRKWGHNELDDPTFTNPFLYQKINSKSTVPDKYASELNDQGILSKEEVAQINEEHIKFLNDEYEKIEKYEPPFQTLSGNWSHIQQAPNTQTEWDTGMDIDLLKYLGSQSVTYPEDFHIHEHLKKHHVKNRLKKLQNGKDLDWGTAEALALGSLLYQGFNVRISGQDVGRATFSHRHAMLVDQNTNEIFIPLNELPSSAKLELANSILSEEAVMGFEYGLSITDPNNLIIWEAQFGDFFNGAQIILDTFVSNGESKWGLHSGLTILLPHGMDGAGPEHSSCRLERFLQMSDSKEDGIDGDDVNWHIVNPTTSAQYFHLLRRQIIRNFRKPLIVVAPKMILRLSDASSNLNEMRPGTSFQSVIGDANVKDPKDVKKVIFTSGKHYYALKGHRQTHNLNDVAIIRLEQLCPFPVKHLQDQIDKYPNATNYIWSQEEHRNMGAWSFVSPRFHNLVGINLQYAGRRELCQPAVGVGSVHQKETQDILESTFS